MVLFSSKSFQPDDKKRPFLCALSDSPIRINPLEFQISMPLDFKITENSNQSTGLVIKASQAGLLIQIFKDMPIGQRLTVEVSSPKRPMPEKFSAMTEIIWKDVYIWDDGEAYQYGLKFNQISYEDYLKLKQILSSQSNLEEVTLCEESNHRQTLTIKSRL